MDMNLSFSVLTANIISILLIGTLYLANRQKAEYNRDMRLLQQMMVTIGIANISDCCVYLLLTYLPVSGLTCILSLVYRKKKVPEHLPGKLCTLRPWLKP
mgnify:CR=1 FL=1